MSENVSQPPQPPGHGHDAWARSVMWMVIAVVLVGGGLYVFKSCRDMPGDALTRTGAVVTRAGQALAEVASAFRQGTITTTFVSYATSISNNTYLQFATLKQVEQFTRTEVPSTAFGYVPLPDVVVEARAPVEYTYYLDLNGRWRFDLRDHIVHVFAPPIQFNKPAVDASAINYEVRKGFLKTAEAQENLKQSITSLVTLRAKENISLVRENGRKRTAEFVETWLMRSFSDGPRYAVKVYFPDDPAPRETPLPPR